MSRSGGYKCYNIKCGSCIGKTLCGEPGESALACDNRIVTHKTNGDCIRSMSDEMRPNCDKPLTLRRLQEILESNEEIIGCPIIVSENGILSHAVLDARVDDGICAVVSANEHWLKEKDYGKTWIAYAYPPAHIDREAWEPCGELCRNNCMTCDHNDDELFGDADYCKDCHRYSKWESSVHKYCECCGRPKTPEAWAELEKRLRG